MNVCSNINVLFARRKAGDVSTTAKMEYLHHMDGWMRKYSFPKKLRRQIRDYYFTHLVMPADEEEELAFYYDLPGTLRLKVVTEIQHGDLITGLLGPPPSDPSWKDDDDHLTEHERELASEAIAFASEPRRVLHNTTLYSVGDAADCFYLLDQGQVTVSLHGRKSKTVAYAPAILGLSAAFQSWAEPFGEYRSRVRSLTSCVLWKIDVKKLIDELVATVPKALLVMLRQLRLSVIESINELQGDWSGVDERVPALIRRYKEKMELLDSIEASLRATELSEKTVASNLRLPSLRNIQYAEQGEAVAGSSVEDTTELGRRMTSHDSIQMALDQLNRRQATLQSIESSNRRLAVVDGVIKFENSEATYVI